MGRGKRKGAATVAPRPASKHARYRPTNVEPVWGDYAARRYRETYSERVILREIARDFDQVVSRRDLNAYLNSRADVARRKEPPEPYFHPLSDDELTPERERRLRSEFDARVRAGEDPAAIKDWIADELARYSATMHICYNDDPLFNSPEAVAAILRRLKKWHRTAGRPVAGEGFEDLLAGVWRDIGYDVQLAPRGYDGADAHVADTPLAWLAISLKSEAATTASPRTIRVSSLAPHHVEIDSPDACCRAIHHALAHLGRYDRMVYLRANEEHFPGGDDPAQRYTLLELPKWDIEAQLWRVSPDDFAPLFADAAAAAERNTFTIPVHDPRGKRVFNVTVSRRPPRVAISAIEFTYCDLISSFWTKPIDAVPRLTRAQAAAGEAFDADGVWKRFGPRRLDVRDGRWILADQDGDDPRMDQARAVDEDTSAADG
jgi:hypothetical protein